MKQPNEKMYGAATAVLNYNASYASVAKSYGVSPSTIRRWVDQVCAYERIAANMSNSGSL